MTEVRRPSTAPFFSVVIPTFNRLCHLREAIQSVKDQSFSQYEIIVVDDGSVDGTRDWLAEQNNILAVHKPNGGPGAARNVGIAHSKGEYIAFLDSDDVWPRWTLEVFYDAIHATGFPSLLNGCYREIKRPKDLSGEPRTELKTSSFPDYLASSHFPYSVGSGNCVIRKSILASQSFLEDRLNGEDHDLILRIGCEPGFVQILTPVTLGWRRHQVSETADFLRSALGAARLVSREKENVYPGGDRRAAERQRIIARHVRPTVLQGLDQRSLKQAIYLYCVTLLWNLRLRKWTFVLVVPLLLLKKVLWPVSRVT